MFLSKLLPNQILRNGDYYAEASEDLSTSIGPIIQENRSSRRSNRIFQQQSSKKSPLCWYNQNLGQCNQILNKDIHEKHQTLRQLNFVPNCLNFEHTKRIVITDVASKTAHDFNRLISSLEESLVTVKRSTHVTPFVKNITLTVSIRFTISTTIMEATSIEITTIQTASG